MTATLLAAALGIGFLLVSRSKIADLKAFCDTITLGIPDYKLRDLAYEAGYEVESQPHAQMEITLAHWNPVSGSCRVFLNNSRTVELRRWQED